MASIRDQIFIKECKQLKTELTSLEGEGAKMRESYQDLKNQEAALKKSLEKKQEQLQAAKAEYEIHHQKTVSKRTQLEELKAKVKDTQGWDVTEAIGDWIPKPSEIFTALTTWSAQSRLRKLL